MRKTLYLKFILAYILFAFFGFFTVATFVSKLTYEYCLRQTSKDMYHEATKIADTYAVDLYNSDISLETVQKQMEALSYFMDTEIWIINPSGRMVVNSADAPDPETEIIVEGFDPTVTQKNYYTRGTFFDSFDEEKLSVIAPIVNEYKTRGYVIIHKSAAQIDENANSMLNISYLMLIVILFLSLIILIFFTEFVYRPLRKIIAATESSMPPATCTMNWQWKEKTRWATSLPLWDTWPGPWPASRTTRRSSSPMSPTTSALLSPPSGGFWRPCWTARSRLKCMSIIWASCSMRRTA